MHRRPTLFDSDSVIPGPSPLKLSDGRYLFLYNGVRSTPAPPGGGGGGRNGSSPWEVAVGWAVLDGAAPTNVLFRGPGPLLRPTASWEVHPAGMGGVGNALTVSGTSSCSHEANIGYPPDEWP